MHHKSVEWALKVSKSFEILKMKVIWLMLSTKNGLVTFIRDFFQNQ